ncbi:hypothetical protein DPMN_060669 [Dreissena polymorpha]|uniref:Uncharacterized protein n=1 Tax=Dreissena polymorpha TaxID=45954 RepID=A0A9D4HHS0_DREPO|nr:hypothetical protein DPMN_060669 [Dreissena polymorpha]
MSSMNIYLIALGCVDDPGTLNVSVVIRRVVGARDDAKWICQDPATLCKGK